MTLVIDGVHHTDTETPGSFFELNIQYGVHIGGIGNFDDVFLGNFVNHRGCIDNVTFNGVHVLQEASKQDSAVEVHRVNLQQCDEVTNLF